jgi:hypothetical protein
MKRHFDEGGRPEDEKDHPWLGNRLIKPYIRGTGAIRADNGRAGC